MTLDAERPIRVAHVTTAHPATDNRILRKQCVGLAEAGLDVWLLAPKAEAEIPAAVRLIGLPVFRGRIARILLGPVAAWRALRDLQPDVVHVHDPELIPAATLWHWLGRSAVVYDAHEDLPKQVLGKPYLRPWQRPFALVVARMLQGTADRCLDAVVAATPAIARTYRNAPVCLVQNFPWADEYPVVLPIPSGSRTVVYVGGISEARGALDMLEAVRRSRADARLLLAGPIMSPQVAGILEHDSDVATHLGNLPGAEVPSVIAQGAVGLVMLHRLPNYLESQPTKLFEYMAAGRPFVASDFPAWRRLVNESDCGVFVDPGAPEAIRDAIDNLLEHPEDAAAMGKRGRELFEDRFTFESQISSLVALVKRLAA